MARALSAERVDAVTPFIRERAGTHAERLAAALDGGQVADAMALFAHPLPLEVISRLAGVRAEDVPRMQRASYDGTELVGSPLPEGRQAEAARGMLAGERLLAGYVRERHAHPGADLISELVVALAPPEEPLANELAEMLAVDVFGLYLAGHVTTSDALGNAIARLTTEPERWRLLAGRPELIPGAVEELLRHDGPVQGFARVATRPVRVGGRDFPPGTEFFLLYASANRDGDVFERPEELVLDRPRPLRHLAFGFGAHRCVGATLGRRELVVALETLTRRLSGLRLAGEPAAVLRPALLNRGPTVLPVVV